MENKVWSCAVILASARKIGFGLRYAGAEGTHAYEWYDPMAAVAFSGKSCPTKEEALCEAAESLASYLQLKKSKDHDPTQDNYTF